jgi:hypothetical protein
MKTYYFGCWDEAKGHYIRENKSSKDVFYNNDQPWDNIDGGLCPESTRDQGIVKIHHKDGWTAFAFWDYSIDHRPNSNSVFFAEGTFNFDEMMQIIHDKYPEIVKRFDFPFVEIQQP